MKLYHVTFDLEEPEIKVFRPRVPDSAGEGEDTYIPRICLAPSIEKCIQALPSGSRRMSKGEKIRIYEVNINIDDSNLISPDILFFKGYVPDALETEEYWYLKNLKMVSTVKEISSFDYDFELAFSCIRVPQVIESTKVLMEGKPEKEKQELNKILNKRNLNSDDLYGEISSYLNKIEDYDFYDSLWEKLAMLPWAQTTRFHNLVLI